MSLKIYAVVLELVRRVSPSIRVLRARSSALADQMERALISIPLNTAEGAYSRGKNRQARFQSAAASARETLACLETAEAMGFVGPVDPELRALFHRVIGTLVRLVEPQCFAVRWDETQRRAPTLGGVADQPATVSASRKSRAL